MATPRDIRRLALLALYQFDLAPKSASVDTAVMRAALDDLEALAEEGLVFADPDAEFSEREKDRAIEQAEAAWAHRATADAEFTELAPDWPAHRLAAVDRAILRLAHHELTAGSTPPKAAVAEAVELAKVFSGERSPAFVNGLLDKVLKRVLAEAAHMSAPVHPPETFPPRPPLPTESTGEGAGG